MMLRVIDGGFAAKRRELRGIYPPVNGTTREHLFVSYATEDAPLAEWFTRKLTAEGYSVCCDRFKLLGGESYPRDIGYRD